MPCIRPTYCAVILGVFFVTPGVVWYGARDLPLTCDLGVRLHSSGQAQPPYIQRKNENERPKQRNTIQIMPVNANFKWVIFMGYFATHLSTTRFCCCKSSQICTEQTSGLEERKKLQQIPRNNICSLPLILKRLSLNTHRAEILTIFSQIDIPQYLHCKGHFWRCGQPPLPVTVSKTR